MIKIINRHHRFYVGRGTALGNKFIVGVDGTLEEVIKKYDIWLNEQIKNKNSEVCDFLNKIYKTSLDFDVFLECSCIGLTTVVVLIEHKDRLSRFCFNYLLSYFNSYGVRIEKVEEVMSKSFENELVEDILSLMASFSAKIYGRRSSQNRKKKEKEESK